MGDLEKKTRDFHLNGGFSKKKPRDFRLNGVFDQTKFVISAYISDLWKENAWFSG